MPKCRKFKIVKVENIYKFRKLPSVEIFETINRSFRNFKFIIPCYQKFVKILNVRCFGFFDTVNFQNFKFRTLKFWNLNFQTLEFWKFQVSNFIWKLFKIWKFRHFNFSTFRIFDIFDLSTFCYYTFCHLSEVFHLKSTRRLKHPKKIRLQCFFLRSLSVHSMCHCLRRLSTISYSTRAAKNCKSENVRRVWFSVHFWGEKRCDIDLVIYGRWNWFRQRHVDLNRRVA